MSKHDHSATEYGDTRARFTAREFVRMIDAGAFDDMKIELVHGDLHRLPMPETRHGHWQARVIQRLLQVVAENRLLGGVGIELGGETLVGCDAVIVHSPVSDNRHLTPADVALVIEVAVSSVGRDLGLKRVLYAEACIATYWVIHPEREVTHVYRELVAGEYRLVLTVPFDQPLDVPGGARAITLA